MKRFRLGSFVITLFLLMALPCVAAAQPDDGGQEVMTFRLHANSSTGYFWLWSTKGEGAIKLQNETYEQSESLPGAPGIAVFSFTGTTPGKLELRFAYSQTGKEEPNSQINAYQLEVLPDLRIIMHSQKEDVVSDPKP